MWQHGCAFVSFPSRNNFSARNYFETCKSFLVCSSIAYKTDDVETGDMALQVNDLPHSGKAQVQLSRADIKAKFKNFTNLHLVK